MKNHHQNAIGLVEALSKDIALTFPQHSRMATLFCQWYDKKLQIEGLPLATISLPECGKWFEQCLDQGRILNDRPRFHGCRGETIYPKFLYGLWSELFNEDGILVACPNEDAILFLEQAYYLFKKLDGECAKAAVHEAVDGFITVEDQMPRSWPNTWDADVPTWEARKGHPIFGDVYNAENSFELFELEKRLEVRWHHFDRLCRRVVTSWGELSPWELQPKHGPGAVSDRTDGKVKYDFAVWPRKLEGVFPFDWFGSHDFVNRAIDDREPPSILHAVPKTMKGPRLIAAEPTAHQWIQGSLQRWLVSKVRSSPIGLSVDFEDQTKSSSLALSASADRRYASIDLSEASDRLHTRLVEYVFQGNRYLLDAMHACRTRSVFIGESLTGDGDKLMLLRKFASQGSALTFPVQTIVFTLLGHFALMIADNRFDTSLEAMQRRSNRLRVFGDDILIDNDAYGEMTDLLAAVGLKVNTSKSFTRGLFREACGMRAFNGVDVTPAYYHGPYDSSKPETLQKTVEAANNFHKKGMWHTADYLLKTVPERELVLIPRHRKALWATTILSFCSGFLPTSLRRWNKALQRDEFKAIGVYSKTPKTEGRGESSLFQYFTESPPQDIKWEHGEAGRPRIKKASRWVAVAE